MSSPTATRPDPFPSREHVGTLPHDLAGDQPPAGPTPSRACSGFPARHADVDPPPVGLTLDCTEQSADVVVTVVGEIDLATSPDLARHLDHALARPGCHRLVIDLAGVGFLGARGIDVLEVVDARARALGTTVVLVAGPPAVTRALRLTGTSSRIDIVPGPADR